MSAPRLLSLVAAVPLLAVGLAPASTATATAADPAEAKAPTQLLQLTTATGDGTAVAEAGLDDQTSASEPSAAATEAPASTSGGSSVAPGRSTLLAAATDPVDPEEDATLLTEPVAVDDFLVAGFSWTGSAELPTGTQIYLRVREDGQWSDWYLNQASDAGRDDGTGLQGTDEFVTGGADAVQASVVSPSGELPADLNLAMVPGQPTGEEQVDASDLETVEAEPTDVAESDTTSSSSSALGPIAQQTDSPTAATTAAQTSTGSTTGGSAISPAAATLLAATTTANSLPVPVTTRSEWGANESYMTWTREYYEADHVVVHHTAGTNSYTASQSASIVRGIYYYHAVTLGWGDIGYNFLVSKYGQVFEGRSGSLASAPGKMVAGGHALGVNNGTMGISMMGDYTSTSPTSAQLNAVGKMAGWFLARQGITSSTGSSSFVMGSPSALIKYPKGSTQNFTYIFAHRDVNYTTCPGDVGYSKMGQIRSIAQTEIASYRGGTTTSASSTTATAHTNTIYLNNAWSSTAGTVFSYGSSTSQMVTGDWDGNGTDTFARRDGNLIGFRSTNTTGESLRTFAYGAVTDELLVGDWDGNRTDSLAVRRGNLFYIKNSMYGGSSDKTVSYGHPGDEVYVGDWDGDGVDTLAVRRDNTYYIKNSISSGQADKVISYGTASDEILIGDWNGDGKDTFAVRRGNLYYVKNSLSSGQADKVQAYGRTSDKVVTGDWDGNGTDTLGVIR